MTYVVSVTSQGQISIPAPLRRKFNLGTVKKLIVSDMGDSIMLKPEPDITFLRGILKTDKKIDVNKAIAQARDEWAHHLAVKYFGSDYEKKIRMMRIQKG